MKLTYKCPHCGTKLSPIEAMDHATQIVDRLCLNQLCRALWRLKVERMDQTMPAGIERMDKAEFTYRGSKKAIDIY